ncbi:uncharacterized protein EAE98_001889 [Botrytis deweyae]|uniref:Uncharacterized protein n=1 Tax=Botrytis deweyae TaxID=2478750 RepID=A0ABQ7IZ46_9HELO|nr:uncharacterized protein EAE98_001889 [Botrytis deweyae]KAF7937575.1 hypothetical protein EAE98_001889 [Botrytis deweyae]
MNNPHKEPRFPCSQDIKAPTPISIFLPPNHHSPSYTLTPTPLPQQKKSKNALPHPPLPLPLPLRKIQIQIQIHTHHPQHPHNRHPNHQHPHPQLARDANASVDIHFVSRAAWGATAEEEWAPVVGLVCAAWGGGARVVWDEEVGVELVRWWGGEVVRGRNNNSVDSTLIHKTLHSYEIILQFRDSSRCQKEYPQPSKA